MNNPAPALFWTLIKDGFYRATAADGTRWGILQHTMPWDRQNTTGNPNMAEYWWVHELTADGTLHDDPDIWNTCRRVGNASPRWANLHRHPETLRYADALAAGWSYAPGRRVPGSSEEVMHRHGMYLPLSTLIGQPILIAPDVALSLAVQCEDLETRRGKVRALASNARDTDQPLDPDAVLAALGYPAAEGRRRDPVVWITAENAYAGAPDLDSELQWAIQYLVDAGTLNPADREFWLRKAAALDRLALRDNDGTLYGDADDRATAAARRLIEIDHTSKSGYSGERYGPDHSETQANPRGYLRQEYAAWRARTHS